MHEHDVDLEGACEGSTACSTCYVVLSQEHYDALTEPGYVENDGVRADGHEPTGVSGGLDGKLDGMVYTLPAVTSDMFVDGLVARPCV